MIHLKYFGFILLCTILNCKAQDPTVIISSLKRLLTNGAKSTGTLNISVIFIDSNDKPAGSLTTQQMFSVISPSTENFLAANSYGKLKVNMISYFKWLRMNKNSNDYAMLSRISFASQYAFLSEAANLASSNSVDLTKSDEIVVMTNPYATAVPYGPAFTASPGSVFGRGWPWSSRHHNFIILLDALISRSKV